MKKIVAWIMILTLVLGMAAFAQAEETVTLKVLWWGSQTRADLTYEMIAKFEEKYPNIQVEPEFAAWGDYWAKLSTQVSGDMLPDVIQMDYAYLNQYATNGVLAPLDEYFASGAINVSDVSESVLTSGMVEGKTYALATGTNALTLMYDPQLMGGREIPMSMTLSEFVQLAKDIYAESGRTCNYVSDVPIDVLRFRLRNIGLELYSEDGKRLGFDDPAYLAELLEMSAESISEGYGLDPSMKVAADNFDSITCGDTWCEIHWTNELTATETGNGTRLEMMALPSADDATQSANYFKPTMFWSIAQSSQVKDAAALFIDFCTNDKDCADIAGTDRGMPISSVIREYLTPAFDETNQRIAAVLDWFGQEGNASNIPPADPAAHAEIVDLYGDMLEKVQYGLVTDYTAAAQEFMDAANEILASK